MLDGEKIERPKIEELREKYRGLFVRIDEDINDEDLKNLVESFVIELEWNDLYRDLIEKKSGRKMDTRQKRDAYSKFLEEVIAKYNEISPYLKSDSVPALEIPFKKPDISKKLRELLVDHPRVLEAIERLYPFEKKRRNKKELESASLKRTFEMFGDVDRFLKRKKWKRIEGVKNKKFIVKGILPGQALSFPDENGNNLSGIVECQISTLDGNTIFQEGQDYTFDSHYVVVNKSMVDVTTKIEVTISTKCQKFRIVNNDFFSVTEYSDC